jgi:hypothetical protein
VTQAFAVAVWITGILVALATIGAAIRWGWQILTKLARLADALLGEPPGPGAPNGRPGVLDRMASMDETISRMDERLSFLEQQMRPNGGSSLRDTVDRIAASAADPAPDR